MNSNKKLSVVLPAYNEKNNIHPLLEKINNLFISHAINGEVIFVNDGSTDDTGEVAYDCMHKYSFLKVYEHKKNLGLTKALTTGFEKCSGDIIIFLCSDLQSDPEEDIPKLLDGFIGGADVVLGWRQGRKESRLFSSKIYNYLSKILFGTNFHDQNWIKAFKKEALQHIYLKSDWHRFIVPILANSGLKIVEVKTNWYPRKYGKSKYGFSRLLSGMLDMIILKFEMIFLEKPMRFFGGAGIFFLFFGIVIFLTLFFLKHFTNILLPEFVRLKHFLLSILLVILGINFLSLGFLGEIIISYFNKIDNKISNKDK